MLHSHLASLPTPQLKAGYHKDSRCQYQPASFSSAFKLSGTACLVGVGLGVGGSLLRLGTCNKRGHYLSPTFSSCCFIISVLTPFTNYFM